MTEWEMLVAQFLNIGGIVQRMDFLEYAPGLRGVVATEDIPKGYMIMFVPEDFLI